MSKKTTQNQTILIALMSINLVFCGKHEIKKEGAAATDVPVSETAANTQQAANTSLDETKKDTPADTAPPANDTAKAKPIVRDLTPEEVRQITPPDATATALTPEEIAKAAEDRRALIESNKIAAQAKIDAEIAAKKAYVEQVQANMAEMAKTKTDKVEAQTKTENDRLNAVIANPYKAGQESLIQTSVFSGEEKALEIIAKDQITVQEKEAIETAYFKLLENTANKDWKFEDRLATHFINAKENAGIREDLKKHLGAFQITYDNVKDDKNKEILLPLLYAFNLYNKLNDTHFTPAQGPNVYTSMDASKKLSTAVILGRIDLSEYTLTDNIVQKMQKNTNSLSKENIALAQAINQIWVTYFNRYLGGDVSHPLANPVLMGYSNETDAKGKEKAKAYATKVKDATSLVTDLNRMSYIPALGDMTDFTVQIDTYAASKKNKRVELVLKREMLEQAQK